MSAVNRRKTSDAENATKIRPIEPKIKTSVEDVKSEKFTTKIRPIEPKIKTSDKSSTTIKPKSILKTQTSGVKTKHKVEFKKEELVPNVNKTKEEWINAIREFVYDLMLVVETNENEAKKYVNEKAMPIWVKAFTHKSYDAVNNYEVLEFLGDKVVGLQFSKYCMESFDNLTPNSLTKLMHMHQRKEPQAEMAIKFGLTNLFAYREKSHDMQKMNGDLFEAFYGALETVGDLHTPGLGGVLCFNMIVHMYNDEDVHLVTVEERSKQIVIQMFQKLRGGSDHNTLFSKFVIQDSGFVGNRFEVRLRKDIIDRLAEYGVKINIKSNENDLVVIGSFSGADQKMVEFSAYAIALKYLESVGFNERKIKDIKFQRDFGHVDAKIISAALTKAMSDGINEIMLGKPRENRKEDKISLRGLRYGAEDTEQLIQESEDRKSLDFKQRVVMLLQDYINS